MAFDSLGRAGGKLDVHVEQYNSGAKD
jgi:hypothetical protein